MRDPASSMDSRSGAILGIVLIVVGMISFVGVGLMELAARDGEEASKALLNARAFWMAEAGAQRMIKRLYDGTEGDVANRTLGYGAYRVWLHDDVDPAYAVARGRAGSVDRFVRVDLTYLAPPYEGTVFGGNEDGTPYTFFLGGTGDPDWSDRGGRDIINGNVYVNGDLYMEGESEINAAPTPNTYNLNGDAETTGDIHVHDGGTIAGDQISGASLHGVPDLQAMDYPNNNTYDIAAIFEAEEDAGNVVNGYLPVGHPLRDVVVKNPGTRASECASTPGDDYFFEPRYVGSAGTPETAVTPLDFGDGNVYYVDGEAWFNHHGTYGFEVDGQATIVSSGDIHVSDNLAYRDDSSLLGLVALGEYDALGNRISGGDVYFGDPEFGTLYTVDAFMFAGNDFLYNTRSNGGGQEEPDSGFKVFGNFSAIHQVVIYRDWYDGATTSEVWVRGRWRWGGWGTGWQWVPGHWETQTVTEPRAARYDPDADQWVDALTGVALSESEVDSMRHYQMQVTYDERIWSAETQPPRLPSGTGSIFGGVIGWQEVNTSDG